MAKDTKIIESKRSRGRPSLPEMDKKTYLISLRLTKEERDIYQAKATKAGLSLSQWIRKSLKRMK